MSVKTNASQPKKGAGGKRGKKTKLTPELTAATEKLSKDGLNNREIAQALGIGVSTLCEYQNKNPEFLEALKSGRAFAVAMVEGSLYKRARGYITTKVRRKYIRIVENGPDNKPVERRVLAEETIEPVHVPADPTSMALFLNNNAPDRYSRKPSEVDRPPAAVFFQFNVIESDGTQRIVNWDPSQPPPQIARSKAS